MLWSTDTCQNKVSADQYHVTISRAQVNSSLSLSVFLKLTAEQVLVFLKFRAKFEVELQKLFLSIIAKHSTELDFFTLNWVANSEEIR